MNGGELSHNAQSAGGVSAIYGYGSARVELNGGVIRDNAGWGIDVDGSSPTLSIAGNFEITGNASGGIWTGGAGDIRLSGAPKIRDNYYVKDGVQVPRNVYVFDGKPIVITDALTPGASVGVTMQNQAGGVFTGGWAAYGEGKAPDDYFTSDDDAYKIEITDDDELRLSPVDPVTVTFDSDGGSEVASQTIPVNRTAAAPSVPAKNGHIFQGWMLNGEAFDFATPITQDVTLTASWAPGVKIPSAGNAEADFNTLTETSLLIYDWNGPDGNYGDGWDGALTLKLPEGKWLRLTGRVDTEDGYDTLYSTANGGEQTVTGEGKSVSLTCKTDVTLRLKSDPGTNYSGVALLAELMDIPPLYNITINNTNPACGGVAVSAENSQAYPGDVVAVTLTPNTGYMASLVKVTGESADTTISGNMFEMPAEDVTVTVTWAEGLGVGSDFEGDAFPDGWTQEGNGGWSVGTGDYDDSTGAHGGGRNARRIDSSGSGEDSWLIMPAQDLSGKTAASLSFWYINRSWAGDIDAFGAYYRVNGGDWTEILSTTEAHESWTEWSGALPDETLAANVQIGFKMTDNYGYGVGLDDVSLESGGHSWSYAAEGAVITATCQNDPCAFGESKSFALTLTDGDGAVTPEGLDAFNAATGLTVSENDIRYYDGETELSEAPSETGVYTAKLTVESATAEKTFKITAPATLNTAPAAQSLTYNGAEQPLVTAGAAEGGTVQYKIGESGAYSATVPAAKDAGTYTVYYKVVGDDAHTDTEEASVSVTIAKRRLP